MLFECLLRNGKDGKVRWRQPWGWTGVSFGRTGTRLHIYPKTQASWSTWTTESAWWPLEQSSELFFFTIAVISDWPIPLKDNESPGILHPWYLYKLFFNSLCEPELHYQELWVFIQRGKRVEWYSVISKLEFSSVILWLLFEWKRIESLKRSDGSKSQSPTKAQIHRQSLILIFWL